LTRDARDAVCQLKCPAVIQITDTDPRNTFSNCHILFGYQLPALFKHCNSIAQLSHSKHAMPHVSSTDFHTTNLYWSITIIMKLRLTTDKVHDTSYSSASAPSWTRTTVADGQIFSDMASEPKTSRAVDKRNTSTQLHLAPPLG